MIKEIANIFTKDEKIKILKNNGIDVEKNNETIKVGDGYISTPSEYNININSEFEKILNTKIKKKLFPEVFN
jgi:hypothetical protein